MLSLTSQTVPAHAAVSSLFHAATLAAALLWGLPSAVAQTAADTTQGACSTPEFAMLLKNGQRVTGTLLGYDQGVSVVFRSPQGQVVLYPWKDLQPSTLEVTLGCLSSPPPTAVAAPKQPESTPSYDLISPVSAQDAAAPTPDAIPFRLTANRPGVKVERLIKSQLNLVFNGESNTYVEVKYDEWAALCEAPCLSRAPPTARLRIVGRGIISSEPFGLLPDATALRVDVKAAPQWRLDLGRSLAILFSGFAFAGITTLAVGGDNKNRGVMEKSKTEDLFTAGSTVLAFGVALLLVSVPILYVSKTQVFQQPSRRLARLGINLVPRPLGFAF